MVYWPLLANTRRRRRHLEWQLLGLSAAHFARASASRSSGSTTRKILAQQANLEPSHWTSGQRVVCHLASVKSVWLRCQTSVRGLFITGASPNDKELQLVSATPSAGNTQASIMSPQCPPIFPALPHACTCLDISWLCRDHSSLRTVGCSTGNSD